METSTIKPIKIVHDKRLAYLDSLAGSYREMGHVVKVNGRENVLEIYPAGTVIPQAAEEMTIEKWTY